MLKNLRQLVPSSVCLKCDVCCRYPQRITPYTPYFFSEEAKKAMAEGGEFSAIGKVIDTKPFPLFHRDCYICQFFDPQNNACKIYTLRPFDCQLYPFMVTYDKDFKSIILVLDTKCPYLLNKLKTKETRSYIDYLVSIFEDQNMVEEINTNKNFISEFQEEFVVLRKLENLSKRICFSSLGLTRLSLKDKNLFNRYFRRTNTLISSFSFISLYIWSSVLNILWAEMHNALCIFSGNDRDYFLLLPPVDNRFNKHAADASFELLSRINVSNFPLKIENVPEEFFEDASSFGLKLKMASQEYIYKQKDLAELKGYKFKTKRNLVNNFVKNHKYNYRELEQKDILNCLELYMEWASERLKDIKDDYFRVLIEDSYFAQKIALSNLESLGIEGCLIEVNSDIRGYSVGFPLNKDAFAILFETADLSMKGLSQFLFREFTRDLCKYKYINALSDSGLENLKRVKNSYHPIKTPPIFTAFR